MTILLIGMAVFIGVHLFPGFTAARQGAISVLGEGRYRAVFSVIALAGLLLIIVGKAVAPFEHLYDPPEGGRHMTSLFVLAALILFTASHQKGFLRLKLRHPMLLGTAVWGLGHLFANGDLASVILFGGFVLFAVLGGLSALLRGARPDYEPQIKGDLIAIGGGIVVYVALLLLHPYLFGVSAMGG